MTPQPFGDIFKPRVVQYSTATWYTFTPANTLIVVTWQDLRFGGNNDEVMVRYSNDYGNSWSNESRLSYGDYHSDSPIAFSTGNRIHVLWGDRRAVSPGLYYSFNDIYDSIDDELLPTTFSQLKAFPNPFNSSVMFRYSPEVNSEIKIYNIVGQLVKTLHIDRKEVQITWDGMDDDGQPLSSGVYFAAIGTSAGFKQTKVTFLK